MAGRKKEGISGLKVTTGGQRREDRLANSKSIFQPISIDAKNALTVIYMLKSPEEDVVLRAVASLEGFGQKGKENLRLLSSLGIFQYLLPLVHSGNTVTKRFSQKLIGMLCVLEEFRDELLKVENILNTFVDILEKETDMVMHEYAALTLAELSGECEAASDLLGVDNCIETLFSRLDSPDPDVQKNCLDVMSNLLDDVYGIESFVECPAFDVKDILYLTMSSYPVIQSLALRVLKQLLSWCRDSKVLYAFRDASGIENTLEIMENDEWKDLHLAALDLLVAVVDCPDLGDYLLQTRCLSRMNNLMDKLEPGPAMERVLAVLARLAQTKKGRMALLKVDVIPRFCSFLSSRVDALLEASCLGLANMTQYGPCMDSIMAANPISQILEILVSADKNVNLKNVAAYALNILCNVDRRASEALVTCENFQNLCDILNENDRLPAELCKNIIQIFNGISNYDTLRFAVINDTLLDSLMNCIQWGSEAPMKDSSLQVDALECLSGYLIESKARAIFQAQDGARKMISCMKSRYASVREWAGQLVIVASQSLDFVKAFIRSEGLEWLMEQKKTRYSMPSWESAIETILSAYLPAKFAFTGRLDFEDVTENGFYAATRSSPKFFLLEEYLEKLLTPIIPIYVAHFDDDSGASMNESIGETSGQSEYSEPKSQHQQISDNAGSKAEDSLNLKKFMKGADRNSGEVYQWTGSLNTYESVDYNEKDSIHSCGSEQFGRILPDPYLTEYLENLKKRIAKQEFEYGDANWCCIHPKLILDRVRIIADFVTEEMAGPEPNPLSIQSYKEKHINEIKFQLGTTIIPLGYVRMGDYLERAMLFKVLADRIGFPCALVRGSYGRAWIEIAVPVLNIEQPENENAKDVSRSVSTRSNSKLSYREVSHTTISTKTVDESVLLDSADEGENFWYPKVEMECFKAFPTNFLKPNAIVDLIDEPGRVLKINSRDAKEYCGAFLFEKAQKHN